MFFSFKVLLREINYDTYSTFYVSIRKKSFDIAARKVLREAKKCFCDLGENGDFPYRFEVVSISYLSDI